MDEGVNRKKKALELSEYVCPAGFVQAEKHSADRWIIIRHATDNSLATKTNASVWSIDFVQMELVGSPKD